MNVDVVDGVEWYSELIEVAGPVGRRKNCVSEAFHADWLNDHLIFNSLIDDDLLSDLDIDDAKWGIASNQRLNKANTTE